MDPNRKQWNDQQAALKKALAKPVTHEQAITLCLGQHAAMHTAAMPLQPALEVSWSFEDEVWQGLSEAAARRIPPKGEHSIAWMTWHTTRIEDMTFNVLVAGTPQVFDEGGWAASLCVSGRDTGNSSDAASIQALSAEIDLAALRTYRLAVGRRTREIIQALTPELVLRPVAEVDLRKLLADGSVLPDAMGLLYYWGSLTTAGLLLMPATRHPFVHWNEALRQKPKR
jgi:hypothetical protein